MNNLNSYKEFLQARGLSKNYLNMINIWLTYLEDRVCTQEEITKFFLENEYGEQTRNMTIKAGRHYYSEFLQIPKEQNEFFRLKLLKCPRKIPSYLSEKELGQAISYLITYHSKIIYSAKAEALFNFLFYSGCRKQELLNLKRADFDLEERTVKVYGKGKRERICYYPSKVKEMLVVYFNNEVEKDNAFNIDLYSINYLIKQLKKHFTDKNITCHMFRHCVSEDTEALTITGWKKYNKLRIGQKIMTYNIKKDRLEWKPIQNINQYSINEKIYQLKYKWIDSLFTKEHKMIFQKWQWARGWKKTNLYKISDIKSFPFRFIISALLHSRKKEQLGIHKAFILGMLLSDGCIKKRKSNSDIAIAQSFSANAHKCRLLNYHLKKSGINFTTHISKWYTNNFNKSLRSRMMLFRILVDSQKWIFEWLKKDKSPKNNIYSLTLRELQYLFNGMLCGDGTRQKSRCLEYRGQEIEHILLLQTISSLLGYRTQLSKCNKGYHRLYICKRNKIQFTTLKDRLTEVEYNGIVWCPRNINHTFLAKRNNSIFITGNSGAREMLRKGIPIAVVSKILGHASLTTTMIYADENESGRREIYQSKMK